MSKLTHQEAAPPASGVVEHDHAAGFTRRTVLAGAAVTTVAAAIGVDAPAVAQDAAPPSNEEMELFVTLSAALTGIAKSKLSPFADPLEVRKQYFNRAAGKPDETQKIGPNPARAAVFAALMQIARKANLQVPPSPPGIIKQEDVDKLATQIAQGGDDVKFLARSIVLMWYLGSWYEPADLKRLASPGNTNPFIGHEVISPVAYTNGWAWRVAQAHPMGYSDMQFGYWTHRPQPIADFIETRSSKGGG
jgi:hypothetical protein